MTDDSHKRIIILTQEFPKEFVTRLKALCDEYTKLSLGGMKCLLEEIPATAANRLLMLSAPKDVVNSVKEQQGQIVARQKVTTQTHTVVSQVIVNTQVRIVVNNLFQILILY